MQRFFAPSPLRRLTLLVLRVLLRRGSLASASFGAEAARQPPQPVVVDRSLSSRDHTTRFLQVVPRVAPWAVDGASCWRRNASFILCCQQEGFPRCDSAPSARARCCAFPGDGLTTVFAWKGDGSGGGTDGETTSRPRSDEEALAAEHTVDETVAPAWLAFRPRSPWSKRSRAEPRCWATLHGFFRWEQDNLGPFWVRQRNYIVTYLLANPRENPLEVVARSDGDRGDGAEPAFGIVDPFMGQECYWGAVAWQLVGRPVTLREVEATARHVLTEPWVALLWSGWPVFGLLQHVAVQVRGAAEGARGFERSGDVVALVALRVEKLAEWVAEAAQLQARAPGIVRRPGEALQVASRGASEELAAMQRSLLTSTPRDRVEAAQSPRLWAALHELQSALALRGSCPDGAFVVPALSFGWDYSLCVRQPEASTSFLGASLVDKRIANHGKWPDCAIAAQLIPPFPAQPPSSLQSSKEAAERRRCIVLDLGANIGACTLLFSRMGYGVIAVEPEPTNLALLLASLALPQRVAADFGSVSVAPVAVDEAFGSVRLRRDATNAGSTVMSDQLPAQGAGGAGAEPDVDQDFFARRLAFMPGTSPISADVAGVSSVGGPTAEEANFPHWAPQSREEEQERLAAARGAASGLDAVGASGGAGGSNSEGPDVREGRGVFDSTVPTMPLDTVAEDHARRLGANLEDVCLLKMDIEGAEGRALRSAPRLLSSPGLKAISFEYCPPVHEVELLDMLNEYGFTIFGNRDLVISADAATDELLEDRAYRPEEFPELWRALAASGRVGITLTALRQW